MKLHLMVISFFPLLLVFLGSVWLRVKILSTALMVMMILWLLIMPFLIVFVDAIFFKHDTEPEKGENS